MHGRLRARSGAVGARRRPGRLQRQAPGARHGALRADHGGRHPARPGDGRRRASAGSSTAPRAFTPDNEFILGESEVRGFFVAAGFSAHGIAGRGRDRAPGRDAGSSTASRSSTCGRWTSGGSGRPIAVAGATRSRGRSRTTRPTTTSTTRTRSASPGDRCGRRRPTRSSRELGAVVRREVGLGAPELVRVERRRRRRGAPAARLGGRCTGRRRSAPRRSRRGGRPACSTRRRSPSSRSSGRARPRSSGGCARTTSTAPVGSIVYTQLLNRRGGIEADLTVTRLAAGRVPDRHRHGVRQPRRGLAARSTCRTTARWRCAT